MSGTVSDIPYNFIKLAAFVCLSIFSSIIMYVRMSDHVFNLYPAARNQVINLCHQYSVQPACTDKPLLLVGQLQNRMSPKLMM